MSQPVYQDDTTIRDDERLFRRVHIKQLVPDDDTGLARVSSGAFKDKDLSVHIESVLTDNEQFPESCLHNHNAHKLVSIILPQMPGVLIKPFAMILFLAIHRMA